MVHRELRNQLPVYLEHGITGAAGDGRVSAAPRRDYADAAAAVLIAGGPAGAVYELSGAAFTMTELAAVVSDAASQTVHYTNASEAEYAQVLVGVGLPAAAAAMIADADTGLSQGALFVPETHLEELTGRPATALADALREALA